MVTIPFLKKQVSLSVWLRLLAFLGLLLTGLALALVLALRTATGRRAGATEKRPRAARPRAATRRRLVLLLIAAAIVESLLAADGRSLAACDAAELDRLWEQVKGEGL